MGGIGPIHPRPIASASPAASGDEKNIAIPTRQGPTGYRPPDCQRHAPSLRETSKGNRQQKT